MDKQTNARTFAICSSLSIIMFVFRCCFFFFCIYFLFESITITVVTPFIFYCLNYLIYLHTNSLSLSHSGSLICFSMNCFLCWCHYFMGPKINVAYNVALYICTIIWPRTTTDLFQNCHGIRTSLLAAVYYFRMCVRNIWRLFNCKHSIYCSIWLSALNFQP